MAVLDYVNGTLESARLQADRVVAPDSRQKAYDAIWSFALERPILFSFAVAQGLFSLLPVLLFASFVLGTIVLAAISALLFSLFWTGVAALVLGGTLFVTSGLALLAWAWVVGAYLGATFAYGLFFATGGGGQAAGGGGGGGGGGGKGDEEEAEEEERRLLSEKWAMIVKAEPEMVGNAKVALGDKKEDGEQKAEGEKGAEGGF